MTTTRDGLIAWLHPGRGDDDRTVAKEMLAALATVAGWVLVCLPSKVLSGNCPGFFFGNPT
jgi:hypothetical protein